MRPDGDRQPCTQGETDLDLLLKAVAEGEPAAFSKFVGATEAKARRYAGVYHHCVADQDDVLQDAYTSVWLNAPKFDQHRGPVVAWFLRMVRNASIDRLRKTRTHRYEPLEEGALDVEDSTPLADEIISQMQSRQIVLNCIDRLPVHFSSAIADVYLHSQTHSQVAIRAALPLGTVKARVRRGLVALRQLVEERGC